MPRDDFTERVRIILGSRVGFRCSKPECRVTTTGPAEDENSRNNIGVAAHITAAAAGGPRYDSELTFGERSSVNNGIWLCANCSTAIDRDALQFSVKILRVWKSLAEKRAREEFGVSPPAANGDLPAVSLAHLGWQCAALIHSPDALALNVLRKLTELAVDLDLFAGTDLLPLAHDDVVDFAGRRVIARMGPEAHSAFLLGCLGPALLEHHDNTKYRADISKHYEMLFDCPMPESIAEMIWQTGSQGSVEDVHKLILRLVTP